MITQPICSKILVFLPEAAGGTIVARLSERGFRSLLVSAIPEAFDALRSDEFAFAITTRLDIDLVRNIRPLPVINLEVFFHGTPSTDGSPVSPKRFDGEAFLDRVAFLARSSPEAMSDGRVTRIKLTPTPREIPMRWWSAAAIALRMRPHRKEVLDVHSG